MPLDIEIAAPSLPGPAVDLFRSDIGLIHAMHERLAADAGIPSVEVIAVLADDLVAEVRRRAIDEELAEGYTSERVGGLVAGKNVPLASNGSRVAVVFDASLWRNVEDPSARLWLLTLLGHELAHPTIERARHASGALDGVRFPSRSGSEVVRSLSRVIAGEYRADRLADLIAGRLVSVGPPGDQHPGCAWDVMDTHWIDALPRVLGEAHPTWADRVDDYRHHRLGLGDMWRSTAAALEGTLTFLVHAQASADTADTHGAGIGDLLDREGLASLPAVSAWLGGPWREWLATLRRQPLLPDLAETALVEEALVGAGEAAIRSILERIGLVLRDTDDGELELRVHAPVR